MWPMYMIYVLAWLDRQIISNNYPFPASAISPDQASLSKSQVWANDTKANEVAN